MTDRPAGEKAFLLSTAHALLPSRKQRYQSIDVQAVHPTLLSWLPVEDIRIELDGFDLNPVPPPEDLGLRVADAASATILEGGGIVPEHQSLLPEVLCCPTVHPVNAAHLALWSWVRGCPPASRPR